MFRLAVAAPKSWKVYSNEKSDDSIPLTGQFADFAKDKEADPQHSKFHVFKFRQTKSIPFNGLNIVAGKIHEIKTKASLQGRKINVYCTETQAPKIQGTISEHIGKIIKAAVTKMEKLTGIKYPYSKCDVMVLPDRLGLPNFLGISPIKMTREYAGLTNINLQDYYNYKS